MLFYHPTGYMIGGDRQILIGLVGKILPILCGVDSSNPSFWLSSDQLSSMVSLSQPCVTETLICEISPTKFFLLP